MKDDANDDDDDDDDDEDGECNAQDKEKSSESDVKEGEAPAPSSATENSGQVKEDESAEKKNSVAAALPDKSTSYDKPDETEKEEEEKKEEPEVADAEPPSKPKSLVVDVEMEDAEEIQDSAKGEEAPEKRGPGRPKKVQKLTKEQEALVITSHLTAGETDGHLPVEPAGKGFPDGWVFRRIKRTSGSRKDVCDRNYYSPKMSLRFKQRSDAMRFIEKIEEADGDEALAILKYHRKEGVSIDTINKAALAKAAMTTIAPSPKVDVVEEVQKEYVFTEDVPLAPELIRRCLSVLRALCASNSSDWQKRP